MITADKVFKGSTEIIKIYRGATLEWEKSEDKYIKWQPMDYISNDSYSRLLRGKASDSVTLLIKGYASIDVTISYYVTSQNLEDLYVRAYKLDSRSSINAEVNMDTNTSKTITYTIPDDGVEHSIYFTCYGGYYAAYAGTYRVSYSNASTAFLSFNAPPRHSD